MPKVFKLKDESTEIVFDDNDYIDMLKRHLGDDTAEYFDDVKAELEDRVWEEFLEDPYKYCNGDCEKVRELKKDFVEHINIICGSLRKLYSRLIYMKSIDPTTYNGLDLCAEAINACDAAIDSLRLYRKAKEEDYV